MKKKLNKISILRDEDILLTINIPIQKRERKQVFINNF
jgi:hypothetical protein